MAGPVIAREAYSALKDWRYLNQASLGLVPVAATEAMVGFLRDVAQHGNIVLSDAAEEHILDDVRASAAQLLDAPVAGIGLVSGASEALGQIAALLASADGEVVLVSTDFPSITYPWLAAQNRLGMSIRWVEDRPDSDLTTALIDAMSEVTSVVCVSAVQFATGTQVDILPLVRRAREIGARVIIDITQMAGAAPVSMRDWDADALVCSGYKWLSTHGGVAVLALGQELLGRVPLVVGWKGAAKPFDFQPRALSLAAEARKYELSTSAYSSAVGLQQSIHILMRTGLKCMAEHAKALALELENAVRSEGWTPFRPAVSAASSCHIVSLRHPTLSAVDVQQELAEGYRICVSSRGAGIRVSLHGYNDSEDITALAGALGQIGLRQRSRVRARI